jgi:hypothetical protein
MPESRKVIREGLPKVAGMPATARMAGGSNDAIARTPATAGVKTTVLHVLHLE